MADCTKLLSCCRLPDWIPQNITQQSHNVIKLLLIICQTSPAHAAVTENCLLQAHKRQIPKAMLPHGRHLVLGHHLASIMAIRSGSVHIAEYAAVHAGMTMRRLSGALSKLCQFGQMIHGYSSALATRCSPSSVMLRPEDALVRAWRYAKPNIHGWEGFPAHPCPRCRHACQACLRSPCLEAYGSMLRTALLPGRASTVAPLSATRL